jgi:hypothetical protein
MMKQHRVAAAGRSMKELNITMRRTSNPKERLASQINRRMASKGFTDRL